MSSLTDTTDFFVPTAHTEVPAWMNEYFSEISRNLERLLTGTQLDVIYNEPAKRYDGQVVFADGVSFDPGQGRGVYCWDGISGGNGEWILLGKSNP
jgi:hypothetical protein